MTAKQTMQKLRRSATQFITGGFRPTNQMNESWIGKVYLYQSDEEIPRDGNGELMTPVAQLYLADLPFVPPALEGVKAITLFMALDEGDGMPLADRRESMGSNWCLREYKSTEELVIKTLAKKDSCLKPFPLKAVLLENDYPVTGDKAIPNGVEDELRNYHELYESCYTHKLGGWPTFCQSPEDFGEDFDFVLQLASDEKANLNIFGSGQLLFAKNNATGEWKMYYDFY